MDDGQLRQALHVAADIGQGLARQAVHEVQGQVVDAGIVSRLDGPFPLGRRVDPAQEGQHGVGKGLDAQTQAVDAAIGQGCRLVIAQAVRIGFHGNFCIVSDAEGPPQRLQDAADFAGRQQGRRAAADVYRIGFFPGIRRRGDVPAQCLDVAVAIALQAGIGRKVAVQAFMAAERDVDVQAQRHSSSTLRTAMKASCGISTVPNCFMRFLPSFCFSKSLRLREISPP